MEVRLTQPEERGNCHQRTAEKRGGEAAGERRGRERGGLQARNLRCQPEQQRQSERGQQRPQRSTGQRNNQVLQQDEFRQTRRARTERGADGELAIAIQSPHQNQMRHVGAGQQPHQRDGRAGNPQRRAGIGRNPTAQRRYGSTKAAVHLRMLPRQHARHTAQFSLRLRNGHAGLQPPNHLQRMKAARFHQRLVQEAKAHPNFTPHGLRLARADHAHNRHGPTHQLDLAADNRRIGIELPTPQRLMDHHHRRALSFLIRRIKAAQQWPGAEQREQARRTLHHLHLTAFAAAVADVPLVHRLERVGGQTLKAARLPLPIGKVWRRHLHGRKVRMRLAKMHQTLRRAEGQRIQQHLMDDGEDRHVHADAHGDGQDCGQREGGRAEQRAEGRAHAAMVTPPRGA